MKDSRIVEVEWEDATQTHGWSKRSQVPAHPDMNRSVGYVVEENERHLLITEALVDDGNTPEGVSHSPYGCTLSIPRSAIRKVWELRRKR